MEFQIDSLADIICFGVGPTLIAYRMGMNHGIGVTILMFYVLAGLIRLAWYNVSEEIRQEETTENRECYQGLSDLLLWQFALSYFYMCFRPILGKDFIIALHALVLIVGLLLSQISDSASRRSWDRLSWLSLSHWQCCMDCISGREFLQSQVES